MALREWLIILGLVLVTLIVVDGVRRLKRQRHVPRLDETPSDAHAGAEEPDVSWELPSGGARVVKPAERNQVEPKPKLERQEHPGPSRVLAGFRQQPKGPQRGSEAQPAPEEPPARREPSLSALEDDAPGPPADAAHHDATQHDAAQHDTDEPRGIGASMQRLGASLQKSLADRREQKQRDAESSEHPAPGAGPQRADAPPEQAEEQAAAETDANPVLEKVLRHAVSADHARVTLSDAEELIVVNVMARAAEGFSGTALLDLMLLCGLRYDRDMGVFHRFETEDPESRLQFTMVNRVNPGTFPVTAMDEFSTPGITLLMPLPGAEDSGMAFDAMIETAYVAVRHLGGELQDEQHSVMTTQTVEFARQRVLEFVRRHQLHRHQE